MEVKIDGLETKRKMKISETCGGTATILRRITSLEQKQ